MGIRLGTALAVIVMSLHAAAAPSFGDDEEWSFEWREGFRLESGDGRFALKFGGRLQTDFTFALSQSPGLERQFGEFEDRSEIRRARLFFQGTVYERVEFKIQYDFATGEAEAKDVYLGFLDTPVGNVRLGHYKEPFSLETVTSSKYLPFVERSLPVIFAPGRNMGLMFHDANDRLSWAAGVFRESDEFAASRGEDQTNFTGRLVFRPIYEDEGARLLHVGLSATTKDTAGLNSEFRARPEVDIGDRLADTGEFASDGQDVIDLELAGVFGPLWFAGEYMDVAIDTPDRGTLDFSGYYAQVGYFLTGEARGYKTSSASFDRTKPNRSFDGSGGAGAWEVALRYSSTDLNDSDIFGGELDSLSAAVNWYVNPVTKMMLNWVHPDLDGVGDADFVVIRAQLEF